METAKAFGRDPVDYMRGKGFGESDSFRKKDAEAITTARLAVFARECFAGER